MSKVTKQVILREVKAQSDGSYDIVISTDAVDRSGDVIEQDGWEMENYLANPIVLFGHDYRSIPVGRSNKLWREGGKLVANFSFRDPANEQDPVNWVRSAWEQDMLRAASVGFKIIKSEPLDPDDDSWFAPRRFLEQELLEWSIVPIPANQEALRRSYDDFRKSLGRGDAPAPVDRDERSHLSDAPDPLPDDPDNPTDDELSEDVLEALGVLIDVIKSTYTE